MIAPSDIVKYSVTAADYDNAGSVLAMSIIPMLGASPLALPPKPPAYWSINRDHILRQTIYHETAWSNAVYIAVTKMASLSWRIRGPRNSAMHLRDLMIEIEGFRGWVNFLSKHLQDYLLTDNGAFVEIVRSDRSADGSRIVGLMHLDSLRCTRTRDPDRPVIYRDRMGKYHTLKAHQVLMFSDMPNAGELWNGVGMCAASRAYPDIYTKFVLETYLSEKLSGQKPLSIHFVNNASIGQIEKAVNAAETQRKSQGYASYMGAVIIPNLDPTATPQVATINLAGLPDGFDAQQERGKANLSYANAIGLDPQDLDPQLLASKSLGTGAQSRIIDDKASGKGLIAWRQDFTYAVNEFVSPSTTSFFFMEKDYRDRLQEATVEKMRTEIQEIRIRAGMILPEQGTQLLVDAEDLPPEFITVDVTPIQDVAGDSNPKEIIRREDNPQLPDPSSEAGMRTRDVYSPADMASKEKKSLPDEYNYLLNKMAYHAANGDIQVSEMKEIGGRLITRYTPMAYKVGKFKGGTPNPTLSEDENKIVNSWIADQEKVLDTLLFDVQLAASDEEEKKNFIKDSAMKIQSMVDIVDAAGQYGFAAGGRSG